MHATLSPFMMKKQRCEYHNYASELCTSGTYKITTKGFHLWSLVLVKIQNDTILILTLAIERSSYSKK